jgi:hypothetical protein
LDIAFTAGLVSEMNFSILKREIENLLETLNPKGNLGQDSVSRSVIFNKEFFTVPHEHFGLNGDTITGESGVNFLRKAGLNLSETGVNRSEEIRQRFNNDSNRGSQSKESGTIKDKNFYTEPSGNLSVNKTFIKRQSPNSGVSEEGRQAEILKLARTKNNLTIKDFSLVIKGCSEKTIQRELLRLVKLGVLNKVGERRWSRYSLANA